MIVSPQERKDLIKKTYILKFIKVGSGYKVCKDKIQLGLFLSKITVNDTLKKGDYILPKDLWLRDRDMLLKCINLLPIFHIYLLL